MEIKTATDRTSEFIGELLDVWEASVRATHHFLGENDIHSIKSSVQQGIIEIRELVYSIDEKGSITGFMGVEKEKIEMLFIHPAQRRNGIGRKFICYALNIFKASFVDVNEQNIQGVGFYEHMGFKVINRSSLDQSGNPFPILHMRK